MESYMYLGPKFNLERYEKLEEEATHNFNLDNEPEGPRRNFKFREAGIKILAKARKFVSWIRFSRRPSQSTDEDRREDGQEIMSESIEPIASVSITQVAEDGNRRIVKENTPRIEKGLVLRLAKELEPFFTGTRSRNSSTEYAEIVKTGEESTPLSSHFQQSSPVPLRFAEGPHLHTYPLPGREKKVSIKRGVVKGLARQLEPFFTGTALPNVFYDADETEKEDMKLVTIPPNGNEYDTRLTSSCVPSASPTRTALDKKSVTSALGSIKNVDGVVMPEEGSDYSGYYDDGPRRFFHQLPEEEKKPMIEKGLVKKLAEVLRPHFTGRTQSHTGDRPTLQMRSSSLTSSEA